MRSKRNIKRNRGIDLPQTIALRRVEMVKAMRRAFIKAAWGRGSGSILVLKEPYIESLERMQDGQYTFKKELLALGEFDFQWVSQENLRALWRFSSSVVNSCCAVPETREWGGSRRPDRPRMLVCFLGFKEQACYSRVGAAAENTALVEAMDVYWDNAVSFVPADDGGYDFDDDEEPSYGYYGDSWDRSELVAGSEVRSMIHGNYGVEPLPIPILDPNWVASNTLKGKKVGESYKIWVRDEYRILWERKPVTESVVGTAVHGPGYAMDDTFRSAIVRASGAGLPRQSGPSREVSEETHRVDFDSVSYFGEYKDADQLPDG